MKPAIYLQNNCCPSLLIMTLLEVKKNRDSVRLYHNKNGAKIIVHGEVFTAPILVQEDHHIIVHDLYTIVHYINNRSVMPFLLPLELQAKMDMLMAIKLLLKDIITPKTPGLIKQRLMQQWSFIAPCLSQDGTFMLLDYLLYALSVFLVEEHHFSLEDQPALQFIFESLRDAYKIH